MVRPVGRHHDPQDRQGAVDLDLDPQDRQARHSISRSGFSRPTRRRFRSGCDFEQWIIIDEAAATPPRSIPRSTQTYNCNVSTIYSNPLIDGHPGLIAILYDQEGPPQCAVHPVWIIIVTGPFICQMMIVYTCVCICMWIKMQSDTSI